MNNYDGSWDQDFPPVMRFADIDGCCAKPWKLIEAHPYYEAAKYHEDGKAAARLVRDILNTPENQSQIQKLRLKHHTAIIVPVHAVEAGGKNRIPVMLAEYISKRTGLEVDNSIVQTNKVHRTGTDEWHRFAFRPSYDGAVKTGRNYILVDDIFSLGGSFNELRRFIESHGGKVVHAIALATGRSGNEIAPRPETVKNLIDRYGENKLQSFLKEIDLYDGNYKALTEPEARALRRAASLDSARDRIFAARQAGMPRDGEDTVRGCPSDQKHQTAQITPPDDNHRRGFRR